MERRRRRGAAGASSLHLTRKHLIAPEPHDGEGRPDDDLIGSSSPSQGQLYGPSASSWRWWASGIKDSIPRAAGAYSSAHPAPSV